MQISIRPARLADVSAIAALAGELGYPTSAAEVSERLPGVLNDPEQAVFVVQAPPGDVVAWIHVFIARLIISDSFCDVGGLVVTEDFRGRGIGQSLIEAALAWTREKAVSSIRIRTNVLRESAHEFYERLGFVRRKSQHVYVREIELKHRRSSPSRSPDRSDTR